MAEQTQQRSLFRILREHAAMGQTDGSNARRFRTVNRETSARLTDTEYEEEQDKVRALLASECAKPHGKFLKMYVEAWDSL